MELGHRMHAERTPNPHSVKWVLGTTLVAGAHGASFARAPEEDESPLARALFEIEGVVGVYLASDFATVSKREELDWLDLAQPVVEVLRAHLRSGRPALGPAWEPSEDLASGDLECRIRQFLDEEIRPSIAQDGGDISFAGFRSGVVKLELRGACHGCPSSNATLKQAIESRLREAIPEVQQVVAV